MKWKLAQARDRGKSGWQDRSWTPEQISQALREHVEKGDPLDVANYCMFLAARNEPISPPSPTAVEAPSLREALAELVAAINQIGDPLCGGQNRYLDAISRARAALASPTAGEARDAPDREALARVLMKAWQNDRSGYADNWLAVADAAIAALTGDSR